ncbi:MAG TPA: cupin domain-containing protein, partial [Solirubrobacteraceae bacterium]
MTGRPIEDGALIERAVLGRHTGSPWLEQSVLELDSGGAVWRQTGPAEEVLFVLAGRGTLRAADATHELEAESGAYLPPDQEYELAAPGDEELLLVSVRVPEPVEGNLQAERSVVVRRLAEQAAAEATADREFRIIADPSTG